MNRKLGARKPARFESGPNMTPLVDVVMCILIFLMMVGTFATSELFLQQRAGIFATASTAAVEPDPSKILDQPIVIFVDQPTVDRFIARADKIQTSDADQLTASLTQMYNDLLAIGKKPDDMSVRIQPQGHVRHAHYIAVYEAALKAGFTQISFTTLP